ncbi:MAG TPA: hypothetical protein VF142_04265 [Longimicrobium sp.]
MRDTSARAAEVQASIYRRMSGSERVQLAYEISMTAREFAASRIRHEHPEWSEADVRRELLRIAFLPAPLPRGFP